MKKRIYIVVVAFLAIQMHSMRADNKVEQHLQVQITSDENKIQGVVQDKHTCESLAGAVVQVGNQKTYSDLDGNFELKPANLNRDSCELKVSMISYQDLVLSINISKIKPLVVALNEH